jgi:predicted negative regulator of RcsB-dependent stress response
MSPELKQRIQIFLVVLIVIAVARTGWILWQRHVSDEQENAKKQAANAPMNADYYVTPKKLYPYDLKSAKQLTQQPV